jgi:hypothetical protein
MHVSSQHVKHLTACAAARAAAPVAHVDIPGACQLLAAPRVIGACKEYQLRHCSPLCCLQCYVGAEQDKETAAVQDGQRTVSTLASS